MSAIIVIIIIHQHHYIWSNFDFPYLQMLDGALWLIT